MRYLRALILALLWQFPVALNRTTERTGTVLVERKRKKKLTRQLPPSRPGPKWRQPSVHRGYRSTAPKDVRFSNQKKLRRMFRNS